MNSSTPDKDDMLQTAKEYFEEGKYSSAEPLLNQLILQGKKSPEIFHMLGTVYYDQGKFNKAVRTFRRALDIDPAYTDASVGLSIILNDLGRYEEGQKVFEEAQAMLSQKSTQEDPYINEKLSIKHDELGELYFQYSRFNEALEQYYKALNLSSRKPELTMKVIECFIRKNDYVRARKELQELLKEYPDFVPARIKLGQVYYENAQVPEAVEQWENALRRDPNNAEAQKLLRQSQAVETTAPSQSI